MHPPNPLPTPVVYARRSKSKARLPICCHLPANMYDSLYSLRSKVTTDGRPVHDSRLFTLRQNSQVQEPQ